MERPAARPGQRALAEELTTLVPGADECPRVIAASQALFGQGEFAAVDERTLDAAKAEIPSVEVYIHDGTAREAVGARANGSGELPSVADLMAETKIVPSKSAARGAIAQGGAYLNNQRVPEQSEGHRCGGQAKSG